MNEVKVITFDEFYGKTEEQFSVENKNQKRKELKRQYEASYDKFLDLKLLAEKDLRELTKDNFELYSLDKHRIKKQEIKDYENAMKELEDLHKEFFNGEEIRK